jgi:hypothetical protein
MERHTQQKRSNVNEHNKRQKEQRGGARTKNTKRTNDGTKRNPNERHEANKKKKTNEKIKKKTKRNRRKKTTTKKQKNVRTRSVGFFSFRRKETEHGKQVWLRARRLWRWTTRSFRSYVKKKEKPSAGQVVRFIFTSSSGRSVSVVRVVFDGSFLSCLVDDSRAVRETVHIFVGSLFSPMKGA